MIITKTFEFDAAHNLIEYKGKCENLHGHTYVLEVSLKGTPKEDGLIIDFKDIKEKVEEKIISKLDHAYINDILKQPTAENIVIWIWDQLKSEFDNLYELKLYESRDSYVTYNGQ